MKIPALHIDHYDLNMPYAWWKMGRMSERFGFSLYFRQNPFGNGFAVFAGLERIIYYIENLRFTDEDIGYLRNRSEKYDEEFLDALRNFRFQGHIDAVHEGEVVFPNEPLVKVEGDPLEVSLIEAALLNIVNWQTPVATKASRIKQVAGPDGLIEMATRRMPEIDAAIWGARAAYIAGFGSTSNTYAEQFFEVPAGGTMGHMWVQSFEDELEAFRAYAEVHGSSTVLLVDTYDTLRSGVPNAITAAKELEAKGNRLSGIRLDSGDLAYLSSQARQMLDNAGLRYVKIVATNNLDEHVISSLKQQGAKIDVWGVGTALATVGGSLGAVYKMQYRGSDGSYHPVIKVSENIEKTTIPGNVTVYRLIDQETGMARGDLIALEGEELGDVVRMRHPVYWHKEKEVRNFQARKLLQPIYRDGIRVYSPPPLREIRKYHKTQLSRLWPEYRRIMNPEEYAVSLSDRLWKLRNDMIRAASKG